VSRTLVVVPTYNEAENVAPLQRRIGDAVPEAEVLFIDDASPDGTAEAIGALRRTDERVRLLRRPRKLGLGTAYLAGFDVGLSDGFDRVVTMDADLSHDPSYLPRLLEAAAGHDLVLGSRYVAGGGIENWGLHRRVLSRTANWMARHTLGLGVRDLTTGFRVYTTTGLRALPLDRIRSSGYAFLEEITFLAARRGLAITEVPIVFCDRQGGRSKISASEIYRAAYHLLRLGLRRATGRAVLPEGLDRGASIEEMPAWPATAPDAETPEL
jgi:dolichol-phosphate mannosyltransferase